MTTAIEPSLTRAFDVTPAQAVAQQASALATNKLAWLSFAAALEALSGVTLGYECNATVAGTPNDGVARIATVADVTFADAGARTWKVLKLGAALGNLQLLVGAVLNGGTTGDVYAHLSHAGFTGGSTTAFPTVGAGDLSLSIATTLAPLLPTANYAAHFTAEIAENGTAIRLVALGDASPHAVFSLLLIETLYDAPAALYLPVVAVWHSNDHMADLSVSANRLFGYATATTSFAGNMTIDGATSGPITAVVPKNDLDGKRVLFPTIAWDSASGYLGTIPDLWWGVNDGSTYDTTIPTGTARHWASYGEVVIPHDSTTDLGNGSTNAHPIGYGGVSPALLAASPDNGTSLGAFDAARWIPVVMTFDVPPGMDPHVYAQIGAGGDERTVYRRDSNGALGFAPLFATLSTAVQVGNRWTLSVLPLGGWWDAPTVWPGVFAEAV